jgi:hypothetical protein
MITWEEARYYYWLGQFYSGAGETVELGPWLGLSTFFIVRGLTRSERFLGKRLHVFDAFIWNAYMDKWYPDADRPRDGESFLPLFERYARAASISESLVVSQRSIFESNMIGELPRLSWSGGRIEFLYVDCGFTFVGNEAWWRILSPHFIPGKTIVAMQDWQSFKFPHQPLNEEHETKQFTDSKGGSLQLIHELRHGSIGTFLFVGT